MPSDRSKWTCEKCNKKFSSSATCERHLNTVHKRLRAFKCHFQDCDKDFARNEKLLLHIRVDHEGKLFKCDICGHGLKARGELVVHIRNNHTDPSDIFQCDVCNRKLASENSLELHKKTKHKWSKGTGYECDHCDQFFELGSDLKAHVKDQHPETITRYKCDECDQTFSKKGNVNVHIQQVHREAKFKCRFEKCGKAFKERRLLERHINYVHLDKVFKCEECDKTFHHMNNLKAHQRYAHQEKETIECDICLKKYADASTLAKHKKSVHERKFRVKCDQCEKVLSSKSVLKAHVTKCHSDQNFVRCFSCPQCEKTFKSAGNLKQHAYTHRKTKDFRCDVCDKTFRTLPVMLGHLKNHNTSANEFACDWNGCDRGFKTSSGLEYHIKTFHLNQTDGSRCDICDLEYPNKFYVQNHYKKVPFNLKRFRCPKKDCSFEAYFQGEINRHVKYHGSERPFKCDVCDSSFATNGELTQHVKKMHVTRFQP